MAQTQTGLIAALWAALLTIFPVAAQEPPPPPPLPPVGVLPTEPLDQWLDEVRAQRQVREERRRAAKEAMDARRRWIDPWGAAQQEAREQEVQRRRDAFMEKIERDREAFRNQVPWAPAPGPWQEESPGAPTEVPPSPSTDAAGTPKQAAPPVSPYPLPGWDNRWYYRGF